MNNVRRGDEIRVDFGVSDLECALNFLPPWAVAILDTLKYSVRLPVDILNTPEYSVT